MRFLIGVICLFLFFTNITKERTGRAMFFMIIGLIAVLFEIFETWGFVGSML